MSRVSQGGPLFWLALGLLVGRGLEVILACGLDVLSPVLRPTHTRLVGINVVRLCYIHT